MSDPARKCANNSPPLSYLCRQYLRPRCASCCYLVFAPYLLFVAEALLVWGLVLGVDLGGVGASSTRFSDSAFVLFFGFVINLPYDMHTRMAIVNISTKNGASRGNNSNEVMANSRLMKNLCLESLCSKSMFMHSNTLFVASKL